MPEDDPETVRIKCDVVVVLRVVLYVRRCLFCRSASLFVGMVSFAGPGWLLLMMVSSCPPCRCLLAGVRSCCYRRRAEAKARREAAAEAAVDGGAGMGWGEAEEEGE